MKWKKIVGFLCSVVFCTVVAVGVPQIARAADVVIDATTFPDATFMEYVSSNFDKNNDKKLSAQEIARVTKIDVSKKGIGNLTGVEYFTALTDLNCSVNPLTTLDVSKNTALTDLNCSVSYSLETLDVSNNKNLTSLKCDLSKMKNLKISEKNTALIYLNCSNNQITTLDVSKNTALKTLTCNNNKLTTLNVSKNTALINLFCGNNQLTTLDVSKNTVLKYLMCNDNQLTTLDLSKNTVLEYLTCNNNSLTTLTLHSQTYDILPLYKAELHDSNLYNSSSLSDLQNVIITKASYNDRLSIIKVIDITKPATYKVDGKDFTIIYVDTPQTPTPSTPPSPSMPPIPPATHIFSDYDYKNLVTYPETIYGNGMTSTVNGQKISNKVFTAYTDITASYKYTLNNKGVVIPSVGKVIVAVTKSAVKPTLDNRNKITDTSASKIATARIKNGQITVTAVGKEGGFVYLWVIDTGDKGVSACCLVNVKLAPTKLEVQDTSGNKLTNTKLVNGKTLDVYVAGTVSNSTRTDDGTYTATVDTKYQSYVTVTPAYGSKNRFTITATGLNNNKNTKVSVTFKCNENGKKISFPLTITVS